MRVSQGFMRDHSHERIENYARQRGLSEITLEMVEEGLVLARQTMEEAIKTDHSPKKENSSIIWHSAAEERIQKVPEGFMREMTRQRLEAFARRKGIKTITSKLIDEKYAEWATDSDKQNTTLIWENAALERIQRVPNFIRGRVILEIERRTQEMKKNTVTLAIIDKVRAFWEEKGAFHKEI